MCRQKAGDVYISKTFAVDSLCWWKVHGKCADLRVSLTLHALPLNGPANFHNDTLYLRWCASPPEWLRWRKARGSLTLASVYCLWYSGWRQPLKKTAAEKHFVLVGRLLLRFCNHHHYQTPRSLYKEGGKGEVKGMLFHTVHKSMGQKARKRCGCLAVCLSALFPPCSSPSTPSFSPTADSGQESPRLPEQSCGVVHFLPGLRQYWEDFCETISAKVASIWFFFLEGGCVHSLLLFFTSFMP